MISGSRHSRCLVLSRIGIGHRLEGLLCVQRSQRSWDLALSIYDADLQFTPDDCVDFLHRYRGGKWDGIHAFFGDHPELLDHYDYFWLVDDDIEATAEQVDALFAYVSKHNFEIAQPALTLDSYYSHRLTLQCAVFRHRQTNFVELMMPVLSRQVLSQVLPCFESTRSGLGLDWLWNRFVSNPSTSVAIIDAIAVPHRRPLNRHLRGRMANEGVSFKEERRRNMDAWQLRRLYPLAFAGLLDNGRAVASRLEMSARMTKAYWARRHLISHAPWRWWDYVGFALRQAFSGIST